MGYTEEVERQERALAAARKVDEDYQRAKLSFVLGKIARQQQMQDAMRWTELKRDLLNMELRSREGIANVQANAQVRAQEAAMQRYMQSFRSEQAAQELSAERRRIADLSILVPPTAKHDLSTVQGIRDYESWATQQLGKTTLTDLQRSINEIDAKRDAIALKAHNAWSEQMSNDARNQILEDLKTNNPGLYKEALQKNLKPADIIRNLRTSGDREQARLADSYELILAGAQAAASAQAEAALKPSVNRAYDQLNAERAALTRRFDSLASMYPAAVYSMDTARTIPDIGPQRGGGGFPDLPGLGGNGAKQSGQTEEWFEQMWSTPPRAKQASSEKASAAASKAYDQLSKEEKESMAGRALARIALGVGEGVGYMAALPGTALQILGSSEGKGSPMSWFGQQISQPGERMAAAISQYGAKNYPMPDVNVPMYGQANVGSMAQGLGSLLGPAVIARLARAAQAARAARAARAVAPGIAAEIEASSVPAASVTAPQAVAPITTIPRAPSMATAYTGMLPYDVRAAAALRGQQMYSQPSSMFSTPLSIQGVRPNIPYGAYNVPLGASAVHPVGPVLPSGTGTYSVPGYAPFSSLAPVGSFSASP